MLGHAEYLLEEGYHVLALAFRGSEDGVHPTFGDRERLDAVAAIEYLVARPEVDAERIGLHGRSLGSSVALRLLDHRDVRAVVAEGPFDSFERVLADWYDNHLPFTPPGLPALTLRLIDWRSGGESSDVRVDASPSAPRPPILVIEDEADSVVPPGAIPRILKRLGPEVQHWVAPGAPHGEGLRAAPGAYRERVLTFWRGAFAEQRTGASE